MEPTEDLSARVLLRHILSTEPPRTPVTRSASKTHASTQPRRRSRQSDRRDAAPRTPQDILRRSLRLKMHESVTRKSLPATKRRSDSVALRQTNTLAPTSMLLDDGDTPRRILMNILQTEPVRSPVVHKGDESEEPQPSSASPGTTSKRPSVELSGLDLPDLSIVAAASAAKGLSRKRPRRSLNVTAFERRLKDGDDVEEENEESIDEHASLSLSNSTSLSLKTPFVDVRTAKRGLQRRASQRRKITEEEFSAAVNQRQIGEVSSTVERGISETAYSEGFTLGLSKLSEPDITTDVIHCNTALYPQPDATAANFSILPTQDKPTAAAAAQLERQVTEVEPEPLMEARHDELMKERSMHLFPDEEGVVAQNADTAQSDERESRVDVQTDVDIAADSQNAREEDGAVDSPTDEDKDGAVDSPTDEDKDGAVDSPTDEDKDGEVDIQPEDDAARSQSDEEEVAPDSQTEEDGAVDSPAEEEGEESEVDLQPEEDAAARSQSDGEEVATDSQAEREEDDGAVEEVAADGSQSEEEEDVAEHQIDQENSAARGLADSQAEDEQDGEPEEEDDEQPERDLEHVSRRAHRSGVGVVPVMEAEPGWTEGKSKDATEAHNSLEMGSHEIDPPHLGTSGLAESPAQRRTDASRAGSDADKENASEVSVEDGGHPCDDSPEEAAAEDPAVHEEEWQDGEDGEESEEVPSKTPAFVKEKRKIFLPDPETSPSALKNVGASTSDGLPASKPKQRRKRTRPASKEGGLPKSYLMNVFRHFAKTKVSTDVYPVLKDTTDKFFVRLAEDLEAYALHAKRKTIEVEDVELLLKRQGYVNDKVPVEVLIEKYLRMDQRKLLIPIATSGNVVIPMSRR